MKKGKNRGGSCSWKIFCAMSVMRGCLLLPPPLLPQTTAAAVPFSLPHTSEKIGKRFFFSDTGILLHVGISLLLIFAFFFLSLPSVCQIVILRQRAAEVGEKIFLTKKTLRKETEGRGFLLLKYFAARPPGQERRFFKEK